MFHVTNRLLLRPAWPEDWADVLAGVGEREVVRNLARAPWPYDEAAARAFTDLPQNPCLPHFLVIESRSGRAIGSAGLGAHGEDAELGYWLRRDAWGRGYATEAAAGVLAVARMIGHRRVVAGHFEDNPASGRVLRKLGFVPTGKPARRYSLARGEDVSSIEFVCDLDPPAAMPQAA